MNKALYGIIKLGSVIFLASALVLSTLALADDENPNCKLTTRSTKKSGKVEVKVEEVYAATRGECEAKSRELMVNPDPEEYASVRTTYAFRNKR